MDKPITDSEVNVISTLRVLEAPRRAGTRKIVTSTRLGPDVRHGPPRPGDVRHSMADISAGRAARGFEPVVDMRTGLAEYLTWARTEGDR